jgi:hypothetical protein
MFQKNGTALGSRSMHRHNEKHKGSCTRRLRIMPYFIFEGEL